MPYEMHKRDQQLMIELLDSLVSKGYRPDPWLSGWAAAHRYFKLLKRFYGAWYSTTGQMD